jgi:hypothetical protein
VSDVTSEWIAAGGSASGFGVQTQAIFATQNVSQVAQVGLVASQAFLRALVDAATAGGTT